MTEKKSNFLPLLLIGGGLAGAALLYGFGSKKVEEDTSFFGGVGTGGSGDFFGSSGTGAPSVVPFPFYNASDVMKGFDSTDLGIEDFAYDRANPDAYTNPSEGGANPENVFDDSGEWTFVDTAVLGITAAAAAPAVAKGVKSVGSKVVNTAKSAGSKVVSSTAGKAATSTAGKTTASTIAKSALKKAGIIGGIATAVDILVGTASAPTPEYDTAAIRTTASNISTDLAAKVGIGNMVTSRQEAHAKGISGGKYPITTATPEEASLVNQAVGLESGDVLKIVGDKFTSYVPEKGMQVTYSSGGTLKDTVNKITQNKAKKSVPTSTSGTKHTSNKSSSGSATTASLSKLFRGK